jgi:hypothetical protein
VAPMTIEYDPNVGWHTALTNGGWGFTAPRCIHLVFPQIWGPQQEAKTCRCRWRHGVRPGLRLDSSDQQG